MFVTFLKFAENRGQAPEFMAAHNGWIAQGFADGVFLCAGSLVPGAGGRGDPVPWRGCRRTSGAGCRRPLRDPWRRDRRDPSDRSQADK